jgi:hypothetical protein
MPLLFKSTNLIDDTQPYCYGTIEVADYDETVYFMQVTLRATNAATADAAVRAIATALEIVTNLRIKSVEVLISYDKIEGDNPIPAYGNQRENQGLINAVLSSNKFVAVPIPNPIPAILDTASHKYLDLSHPALVAFLNHLKSGKILIKGDVPVRFQDGFIRHKASGKGEKVLVI